MSEVPRLTTSVVIITKDRPENIRNLLQSLVRQSLKPDEVLVIDNNSIENYGSVFYEFRDLLPLQTVVETTPGIPFARNRGIREARGEIILFTDDDCEADPF
ncbi:MAG: glycosyltransferase family 2 protein, partial [Thermodesulfobacteriota bacterium]